MEESPLFTNLDLLQPSFSLLPRPQTPSCATSSQLAPAAKPGGFSKFTASVRKLGPALSRLGGGHHVTQPVQTGQEYDAIKSYLRISPKPEESTVQRPYLEAKSATEVIMTAPAVCVLGTTTLCDSQT